jgi:hypothetical protein
MPFPLELLLSLHYKDTLDRPLGASDWSFSPAKIDGVI